MARLNWGGHKITTFNDFHSRKTEDMGNVKMLLFIHEHSHMKQYNSNHSGKVYHRVLLIMEKEGVMIMQY